MVDMFRRVADFGLTGCPSRSLGSDHNAMKKLCRDSFENVRQPRLNTRIVAMHSILN